jgi:hypothetical protein
MATPDPGPRTTTPPRPFTAIVGTPDPDPAPAAPTLDTPADGIADVMGMLFANDAIGSAIPLVGDEDEMREIGDLERNTPPVRAGYVHAWIRGWYADGGKPDTKNLNKMLATRRNPLGWTPRVPTPEEAATYSIVAWGGHSLIAVNGMILMERTVEADQRARRINRNRIEQQSLGANLESDGAFDHRFARQFGKVTGTAKVGRDAADYIDS